MHPNTASTEGGGISTVPSWITHPATIMDPAAAAEPGLVVVSNSVVGQVAICHTAAVLAAVYATDRGPSGAVVEPLDSALAWIDDGWAASLDLFLWSMVSNGLQKQSDDSQQGDAGSRFTADLRSSVSLGATYESRRTTRRFGGKSSQLGLDDLGRLLAVASAATDSALHDTLRVQAVLYGGADEAGCYDWDLATGWVLRTPGHFRETVTDAFFGQGTPRTAAWTIFVSANIGVEAEHPVGARRLRELYVLAGRYVHRMVIAGEAFAIPSFPTAAFRDSRVEQLLGLEYGSDVVLYSLTQGFRGGRLQVAADP